ncbi:peptidylprolyl isomerase [Pseudomonadota bacterium]|nr:peptidylprolyl isomerase [Pseudomonadota bacterium]
MRLKVIAKKLSIPLVFNPNKFLILSALLGFLGAFIFAIVDFNFQSIDAPATVNGYPIDAKRFQAYLSAVESSRKFGLRSEDRLNVLNLLINEELLIQRAKDLGLIENDNEIRDVITSRMLNYIIEPLQNNTVDELSLKSFYESNIQMFANPDQYLFEEWIFNSEFERSKLVELLEADNFFKPDFKYKKTTNNWLPRSYVSFEKISDYLGSEKAQLLTEVEENNFILFSDYQRQDFSVYFLIDKISKPPRAFQEIKDIVMIEYKKSQENEVIEDYLNKLRETYIVEISDDF